MRSRLVLLVSVLALGACSFSMADDDRPERGAERVFVWDGVVASGQTVRIRNMRGEIEVEPSPDDTVRVVTDMRWRGDADQPRDVRFSASTDSAGVLICSLFGRSRCTATDYNGSADGVRIGRRGLNVNLGGRNAAAVFFKIQVPAGVKLDLVVVDGDITSASSAPVRARTVNGSIKVATAVGPVRAETVNGDVDARMTTLAGSDSVSVVSVNGNAWVFIPEAASVRADVATVNGRVLTDFDVLQAALGNGKRATASLGAGATPLRAKTLNGDVGVGRLDAEGRSYLQP